MERALTLARQGQFTARPNPCVGCVLVKDGHIVGEGYHHKAGEPHAEIMALKQAGSNAAGATCYVTLEPCNHQGRTGPCVKALIEAKIVCVVAAMSDPAPWVSGQGFEALKQAGIVVEVGLLEKEARALNSGFLSSMEHHRPYVRAKMAVSLDGRIALPTGASQWLSSSESRQLVQKYRAMSGAILSTSNTVLQDNPSLLVRDPTYVDIPGFTQPLRVILDTEGRLLSRPDLQCWQDGGSTHIITAGDEASVPTSELPKNSYLSKLKRAVTPHQGVDLDHLMIFFTRLSIQDVLVEAGGVLLGQLFQHGLVDELLLFMAPKLLGHTGLPLVHLPALTQLAACTPLSIEETILVGGDLHLRIRVGTKTHV